MHAKLLDRQNRVYAVIFDTGEDPVAGLTRFAEKEKLDAASFTAIGAFSEATLGPQLERIVLGKRARSLASA